MLAFGHRLTAAGGIGRGPPPRSFSPHSLMANFFPHFFPPPHFLGFTPPSTAQAPALMLIAHLAVPRSPGNRDHPLDQAPWLLGPMLGATRLHSRFTIPGIKLADRTAVSDAMEVAEIR